MSGLRSQRKKAVIEHYDRGRGRDERGVQVRNLKKNSLRFNRVREG